MKTKTKAKTKRQTPLELDQRIRAIEIASRTHCGNPYTEIVTAAQAYYEFLKS